MEFMGYKRPDGSVGIRNKVLIISVDECCEGIARHIAKDFDDVVLLTNYYTCMLGGNEETFNQMIEVGKNPNVSACLVIAMGCGSILPEQIANPISKIGKKVLCMNCIESGGTKKSIELGKQMMNELVEYSNSFEREPVSIEKLIVGVKCGGSDTSSGIASNPSVGNMVDKFVDLGGTAIGGELMELLGCEEVLIERTKNKEVAEKIISLIKNEENRWSVEGTEVETMSIGNSIGGLTTLEEKSMGALHKMGSKPIIDVLQVNKDFIDKPKEPGFYLSEATMLCGGSAVNYASYGAQIIVWTTGGAGFNNPLIPVIRVSGNEDLINDDIDIDATGVMKGIEGINSVGDKIIEKIVQVANGSLTNVEGYGEATMSLYQKDQRVEKLLNIPCKR
ncbi:UxaA family hydrolase [Crassaminicella profunda]|uniref:UxaA family hydrolase n=1 Tax=Crassaminicella profunda TaxID=1286698 RepID=UPI001CA7077F|nr:UxaA family hydrolase [Crassaminicella profunda]QZY54944.1 UxaA family hydrolase [Crassaminicella profunda]